MMNILFCGNKTMFDGILTCMLSILKRNKSNGKFCFYIMTMNAERIRADFVAITKEQESFFNKVAKSYGKENYVYVLDMTELYTKLLFGNPNESSVYSPYALLRLLADKAKELLHCDKILYLDADILLNRDITLLYNIDIEGFEYAASRDHYGKYLIHPNFINSGVLLFNMKKCRETDLLGKARECVKARKLIFPDEIAIIKSTTKKKMLPQRFNDQKFLWKHTVVRHFSKRLFYLPYPHTANIKQWNVTKIHKIFGYEQFDDILYEYVYLREKFKREIEFT